MISFQKTQPVEYACLIDVEYDRVSGFVHWALPRFNRRAVDRNEREEIVICKSNPKCMQKMIYANSQLVKSMKMQPENNLGGKSCRLQKNF